MKILDLWKQPFTTSQMKFQQRGESVQIYNIIGWKLRQTWLDYQKSTKTY